MWPIQHPCLRAQVSTPTDTKHFHTAPLNCCQEKTGHSSRQFADAIEDDVAARLETSQLIAIVIVWAAFHASSDRCDGERQ
jgi:hypothetical protein